MRRRLVGIVALLVVAALGSAACSGGSDQLTHAQYQQELNRIDAEAHTKLASSLAALGGITGVDQLPTVADPLNKAADSIDGLADELDKLNPPDDAADANAKLVDALHGLADSFRQLADAAKNKDLQKFQQVGQELQTSDAVKKGNQAGAELRKAGYTVKNGIGQ